MRVIQRSDDRGAIIVIVAIAMVGLLGATALAFDLGNAWQERRELVNATDAAALAGAAAFSLGNDGCTEASNYVAVNDGGATTPENFCAHDGDGVAGTVSVEAEQFVDYAFAPVIGKDNVTIESETMARYGIPWNIFGQLRPFGLCWASFQTNTVGWDRSGPSAPVRMEYGNDDEGQADTCNGGANVPGNSGVLDFNGGSNSNEETKDWVRFGYEGLLASYTVIGFCGEVDPSELCLEGSPGGLGGSQTHLQWLIDEEVVFPLPVFDDVVGPGGNTMFRVAGFATVVLTGFQIQGGGQTARYLEFSFHTGTAQGECCDPGGIDTGVRTVQLCGVETANGCAFE